MHFVTTLVLGGCLVAGQATTTAPAGTDEVARLIAELGADKAATRDEAYRQLWERGPDVEPALHKALDSRDAEVRYRAGALLERFRYGIFADTPPEIVALIRRFRGGDSNVRQEVLKQLSEKQQFATVLALVQTEQDENQRRLYMQVFVQDPGGIVGQMALAGKWPEIERLLEGGATSPAGLLTWTSFLAARKQLDARISHYRTKAQAGEIEAYRKLAYLFRAKGNLGEARSAADQLGDKSLVRALAFESGDWATVARLHDQGVTDLPIPVGNSRVLTGVNRQVELLGYSAAFHRLAENAAEFRTQIAAILKLADDNAANTSLQWYCAESLLINDQPDEAFKLLKVGNPYALFDLLAYRQQYEQAFALVDWKPGRMFDEPWFEALPAIVTNAGLGRQNRFRIALQLARVLHSLGHQPESRRLFKFLEEVATQTEPAKHQTSSAWMWMRLAYVEMRLGLLDASNEHAARVLQRNDQLPQIRLLLGSRAPEAEAWFLFFRRRDANEPVAQVLNRVHRTLAWARTAPASTGDLDQALGSLDQGLATFDESERARIRLGMATTCQTRGRPDLARRLLEPIAATQPAAALKLADALRAARQFPQAAEWYESAWRADRPQLAALWLSGECLSQAGQADEGRKRQEQAESLALTGTTLLALGQGLAAQGLRDAASDQWERILRTGAFEHSEMNEAARLLGDLLLVTHRRRTADLWERHMLANLRVFFQFLEPENYLRFPLLIHKSRAHAAIEAGDLALARREIELGRKSAPHDVRLAEDLVPALELAAHRADADALFEQSYEYLRKATREYPGSAEHHNNLGWLAARCHRRLDEALELARKAVELAPDEPNYTDTLAEAYFHRGDRDEAVRWSKKSAEMAPQHAAFGRQLERFQQAPLPTGAVQPLPDDPAMLD